MRGLLSILLLVLFAAGCESYSEGSGLVISLPYETTGQRHWFAKPTASGTADCTSWNDACTFLAAVDKTASGTADVIHVGVGTHDLDNPADATGTTITTDNVTVQGINRLWSGGPRFVNSDAAATHVLTSTGDSFVIRNVYFDNTGETDEDVIFLNLQGTHALVEKTTFLQEGTAGAGTGILLDNSAKNVHLHKLSFEGVVDEGIKTNGASFIHAESIQIDNCGIGMSIAGASDSYVDVKNATFKNSTTGVSITGATVTNNIFKECYFAHNTANIADITAYDDTHWQDIHTDHQSIAVLPADAGQVVTTGNGAWTWTVAATAIIAADTINNPFFITQVNVQDYDASQTFKIELLYGEAAADTSLGVYEFTVGAAVQSFFVPINMDVVNTAIPATSGVWAKTESSTAGTDDMTITISHQEL
jgi:hypothetical protein